MTAPVFASFIAFDGFPVVLLASLGPHQARPGYRLAPAVIDLPCDPSPSTMLRCLSVSDCPWAVIRCPQPSAGQAADASDPAGSIILGRTADIALDHPSVPGLLSRNHCKLWCNSHGQIVAEDLGSMNGTFVCEPGAAQSRAQDLPAHEPWVLQAGSTLMLGGRETVIGRQGQPVSNPFVFLACEPPQEQQQQQQQQLQADGAEVAPAGSRQQHNSRAVESELDSMWPPSQLQLLQEPSQQPAQHAVTSAGRLAEPEQVQQRSPGQHAAPAAEVPQPGALGLQQLGQQQGQQQRRQVLQASHAHNLQQQQQQELARGRYAGEAPAGPAAGGGNAAAAVGHTDAGETAADGQARPPAAAAAGVSAPAAAAADGAPSMSESVQAAVPAAEPTHAAAAAAAGGGVSEATPPSAAAAAAAGKRRRARLSSGGKDVRKVSSAALGCTICRELLVAAHTLSCGHMFCGPCLAQWLEVQAQPSCPTCRAAVEGPPVRVFQFDSLVSEAALTSGSEPQEVAARLADWQAVQEAVTARWHAMFSTTKRSSKSKQQQQHRGTATAAGAGAGAAGRGPGQGARLAGSAAAAAAAAEPVQLHRRDVHLLRGLQQPAVAGGRVEATAAAAAGDRAAAAAAATAGPRPRTRQHSSRRSGQRRQQQQQARRGAAAGAGSRAGRSTSTSTSRTGRAPALGQQAHRQQHGQAAGLGSAGSSGLRQMPIDAFVL